MVTKTALGVYLVSLAVKLLLIPTYRSTDFEVHRNWLAITHSKHFTEWYTDSASPSEWTLDYPPLFAWFEWVLAKGAALVDPNMLDVNNLNYASDETVVYQRLTVIATEVMLFMGTAFAMSGESNSRKCLAYFLVMAHPALLIVDHIHFQYNGMLLGLLLIATSFAVYGNDILATVTFTSLLCMKHIFLYVAPAFGAYYIGILWNAQTWSRRVSLCLKLGVSAGIVLIATFAPFAVEPGMLRRIASRLFPIHRGLIHAYWAPNAWALYAFVDKVLAYIVPRLGLSHVSRVTGTANLTGGIVGTASFSVLPEVSSTTTAVITFVAMFPGLFYLIRKPYPGMLPHTAIYCSLCAFLFGYHVHEKAILMTIIPMAPVAARGKELPAFTYLSAIGTYSLFPLLIHPQEYLIKVSLVLAYLIIAIPWLLDVDMWSTIAAELWQKDDADFSESQKEESSPRKTIRDSATKVPTPMFYNDRFKRMHLLGLVPLEIYSSFGHHALFGDSWPFIPLMMTSVYCAVGIVGVWAEILIKDYLKRHTKYKSS
jgi:alpha-1,3-glucosyltransferase